MNADPQQGTARAPRRLPSREVLIGKLLSLMIGVQTSLVNVLSGVPRNFVQVLMPIGEEGVYKLIIPYRRRERCERLQKRCRKIH